MKGPDMAGCFAAPESGYPPRDADRIGDDREALHHAHGRNTE
jgi:hypothetical protein